MNSSFMSQLPQYQLKPLVKQITHEKGAVTKDQRLHACEQLQKVLLELRDSRNMTCDPRSVLYELDVLFCTRISYDVKKAVAACIGTVGYIMAYKFKEFLTWLFDNVRRAGEKQEDVKALYLRSLCTTFDLDKRQRRLDDESISATMSDVRTIMETNDYASILLPLLDICSTIADVYPVIFKPSFEDIVDVIIGWYVDIEQPPEVFEQCESTIKAFRRFWLQNISFGKELLNHFLDDAEGYVEEVRESKKSETAPEDALMKSAALLRALTTILQTMGSDVTAVHLMPFIDESVMPRLVRCVDGTMESALFEASDVLAAVAECIGTAIDVSRSPSTLQAGFDLVVRIVLHAQLSPPNTIAVIQFFGKMVEKLPADAIASQMERMIGPTGCLRSLRFSPIKEISEAAAVVYRTALTPKALPSLQVAYLCVVGEMKAALNAMASSANAPPITLGADKAPNFETIAAPDLAEWIFVFLVSATTSLANVKNSLIAMMGLSPNLFELFVKRMPLSADWFVARYPAAHYALLYVLKLHCEKHDHFLANCDWLTDRSRLPMFGDAPTAHHSAAVLDALSSLLSLPQLTVDSRRLCLDWLISFVKAIPKSAVETFRALAEFQRTLLSLLRSAVVDKGKLQGRHVDCVRAVVGVADSSFWNALSRAVVESVKFEGDMTYLVDLASEISFAVLLKNDICSDRLPDVPLHDRRQIVLNGSSFTSFHFRLITDYILHGTPPSLIADESSDLCWSDSLNLVHHECLGVPTLLTANDKWQWAVAEVAQFCVENRLKTPFGKPLETFLQFENEIRGLAKAVVSDSSKSTAKSVEHGGGGDDGQSERESPSREWMRVRVLLNFMEVFDKLMYNAYEGAVFSIAPVSKPARSFFRTNRRTCQEWLGRIRLALMTVALRNQHLAMVIRLANQGMFDLERSARKLPMEMDIQQELMLSITAEALVQLGCEQAILGLHSWAKRMFGTQLLWLKSCADMAVGRYEVAAAGWKTLISPADSDGAEGKPTEDGSVTKSQKPMTGQQMRFVAAQTLDCYFRLRDWSSAEAWVELVRKRESELDTANGGANKAIRDKQMAHLAALSSFDGAKLVGLEAIDWDRSDRRRLNECVLAVTARKSGENGFKQFSRVLSEMLEDVQEDGRAALLTQWPARIDASLQCFERVVGVVEQRLRRRTVSDTLKFDSSVLLAVCERPGDRLTIANDLIYWNEPVGSVADLDFYLNASILARKTSNVQLSTKYLLKHLNVPVTDTSDMAAAAPVVRASLVGSVVPSVHQLRTARHAAKLLWKGVERREGFALLSDAVTSTLERAIGSVLSSAANETLLDSVTRRLAHLGVASPPMNDPAVAFAKPVSPVGDGVREQLSRALLCLGSWMQGDADLGNILLTNEDSLFIKLIEERLNAAESSLGALDTGSVVGSLLILSAHICPELIKAQQQLADWAYKAGKRAIEGSSRDESVLLTSEEASLVTASLPEDVSDSERDAVVSLVSSLKSDDGGIASKAELIERLSFACPRAVYCDPLVEIWERANARLFLFYGCAAQAYFAFLKHNSESSIATVTATLRLLRLLVKHADNIGLAIHEEFASTNPKAWQGVIPQLFARLNHPSTSVRETLCQLLGRVAELAPHTVCFPAVVGGDSSAVSTRDTLLFQAADVEQTEDQDVDEVHDENKDRSLMESCCVRLVDGLRQQNERLVDDVRIFVRELQRITLLREERWLTVLTHLQHEMNKRFRQIEEEKQKTMRIEHMTMGEKEIIISEKTEILTRMAFKILEDLFDRTCTAEAETPNEAQFSAQYTSVIEHALSVYRYDKRNPQQAWHPFQQLLGLLTQRSNKRAALSLEIGQISPVLAAMSGSGVPLPGQETKSANQLVTIAKFSPSVVILPTKTRPKKIGLIGSDGKQYAFLFKGQEDLHLDERIMQFLHICNLMLNEKRRDTIDYCSRNYSVTPLGARSGLIQWVDGATPIFHIYRKWQMREAAANGSNPSDIQRPSEMYYGKLAPALELKGVKDLENRQKWPVAVLKSVMSELMATTPQDLLAKEMWVRSANPDVWWELAQRFARSCAVMSMIGYVIGLGDRHLDNVLVDLDTGEIVHIDYNICFDKGRHLRVPETVPFRMTANMQTALGPTGVDGVFRLSCEHVLRVLRAGRETLMTLLEAFVYDPLVDWAGTHELGTANMIGTGAVLAAYGAHRPDDGPRMAMEFAQKMFAIRRKEICVPWLANRESLAAALQTTVETLAKVASLHDELTKLDGEQHRLEEDAAVAIDDPMIFEGELQVIEKRQIAYRQSIETFNSMIAMSTMQVRTALSAHHQMMLDIRSVLKSLAHMETQMGHKADGRFNRYVNVYKEQFSEPLSSCLRLIDDPNTLTATAVHVSLQGFTSVLASLEHIYDALLKLDYERQQNEEWPTLGSKAAARSTVSPPPGFEGEKARAPVKEEQNVHAKAIWRRVRHKLEGRDPDSNKRSSTIEQTDFVIREATSLSNLALMYEGWTAWV